MKKGNFKRVYLKYVERGSAFCNEAFLSSCLAGLRDSTALDRKMDLLLVQNLRQQCGTSINSSERSQRAQWYL